MKAKFTIQGRLTGLNEYTKACRESKYKGNRLKQSNQDKILYAIMQSDIRNTQFTGKVIINYKWYEPDKRRDLDNVAFAKKYIQDALVEYGILQGDGWRHVAGFKDEFFVDKENPRIEVEIIELLTV